jgi:membrane protein implicated in regulation of membrane protease activity
VSLIIGSVLAYVFLDSPWRYVAIAALAVWEAVEIWIFLRWRKVKSITGSESFAGARGRTLTECRPDGQVSFRGQIWRAHCRDGVDAGQYVVVDAVSGMRLEVSPAPHTSTTH